MTLTSRPAYRDVRRCLDFLTLTGEGEVAEAAAGVVVDRLRFDSPTSHLLFSDAVWSVAHITRDELPALARHFHTDLNDSAEARHGRT